MNSPREASPRFNCDPAQAPAASQPALARLRQAVGGTPNLAVAMAGSPALIEAFETVRALFHQHSTFSTPERELVFLVNATENGCGYCTAIHSLFGTKEGLPAAAIEAVRAKRLPADPRLAALAAFARRLISQRGLVSPSDWEQFLAAGFKSEQAIELVAAAALSTMANYAGRLTQPTLDGFLQPFAAAEDTAA